MDNAVVVEGLTRLNRAFARADKQLKKELRAELQTAGVPIASAAEDHARSRIGGLKRARLTPRTWDKMRVGATQHMVYVAPRQRGNKARQVRVSAARRDADKRFAERLKTEAMEPALEQNRDQVIRRVEFMLSDVARQWGQSG